LLFFLLALSLHLVPTSAWRPRRSETSGEEAFYEEQEQQLQQRHAHYHLQASHKRSNARHSIHSIVARDRPSLIGLVSHQKESSGRAKKHGKKHGSRSEHSEEHQSKEEHHESHGGHDEEHNHEEEAVEAYLHVTFSEPQLKWNSQESELQAASETKVGYIVAMFIFAVIIFDSTLLYLLNCSDPQIQSYSYKLISSVLVVFIALGLTNAQHSLIHTWVGHGHNAVVIIDVIMLGLVLVWFAAIRSAAIYFKVDAESRHATLAVVLHVAAFMLFECLGEWQRHIAVVLIGGDEVGTGRPSWTIAGQLEGYARDGKTLPVLWTVYLGVPLFAMTLIAVMVQVMAVVIPGDPPHTPSPRRPSNASMASQESRPSMTGIIPGSSSQAGHHGGNGHGHGADWEHDAFHAETDVSAIAVGFLLKQLVVFIVLSYKAAPMDCEDNPIECHVGAKRLVIMLATSAVAHGLAMLLSLNGHSSPFLSKVQMHLSMLAVWIALQIADMMVVDFMDSYIPAYSVVHASTMKKLVTAAVLSPLYIVSIIVVDKLADNGLISDIAAEESIVALALLTGLFWEKVADSAIRNFSSEVQAHWSIGLVARLALLAPLVPAWKWYIVPQASLPVPPRERDEPPRKISVKDGSSAEPMEPRGSSPGPQPDSEVQSATSQQPPAPRDVTAASAAAAETPVLPTTTTTTITTNEAADASAIAGSADTGAATPPPAPARRTSQTESGGS